MKLVKQESERVRSKDNRPFMDLYLTWTYEGKNYVVRVRPQFYCDYDKLCAVASTVPVGELIEKYI